MKWPLLSFIFVGLLSFGFGVGSGWKNKLPPNGGWPNDVQKPGLPPSATQIAFGDILAKTPAEIEQMDTASLEWACLGGLSGSEHLDMDAGRARIAALAEKVRTSTKATWDLNHKKDKTLVDSPEFRAAILFYIIQQDYKNAHFADQYDPDHAARVDWGKERPEDLFFQSASGNKDDPAVGNPILIVAVGQALKYPIKLASAPGHFYAVWDDGKTKFIIQDCTGNANPLTEQQFRHHFSATAEEIKRGNLYHEYTQAEMLAAFFQARGNVLERLGLVQHATLAYAAAHRFAPDTPLFSEYLASAIDTRMRAHNLDWKEMDQTNDYRFNLSQPSESKEIRP